MLSFFQFLTMLYKNSRAAQRVARTKSPAKRKLGKARFHLAVEGLEERLVPTVLFQPHFGNEA